MTYGHAAHLAHPPRLGVRRLAVNYIRVADAIHDAPAAERLPAQPREQRHHTHRHELGVDVDGCYVVAELRLAHTA